MSFQVHPSILFLLLPYSTALLQSKYKGRFQYLKGVTCSGPPPALNVSCAEDIALLTTSHPTIECSKPSQSELRCINTCNTQELCSQIWTDKYPDPDAVITGSYGEITFTCTGDSVDAQFVYEDSGDGLCGRGNDVRNVHVAQLGIFCNDIDDFLFDGNSFECVHTFPEGSARSATKTPSTRQSDGVYTCLSGDDCGKCSVPFEPVVIEVDEHRLRKECIVSLDASSIPDVPTPEPTPSLAGQYTASFEANWAMSYWVEPSCTADIPTWLIMCLNSQIELEETLFDTVSCERKGDDTLECTETSDENYSWGNSDPKYSGIRYKCTGPELPETSVDMQSIDVECSISGNEAVARLKLGVLCSDSSPAGYRYYDPYFECASDNSFDLPIDEVTEEYRVYVCYSKLDFPKSGEKKSTKPVGVFTDFRWSALADTTCYTFDAAP